MIGTGEKCARRALRRSRRANGVVALTFLVIGALSANAAGKPHPTYPERQEVPADSAQREAKCALLRSRSERLGDTLAEGGILSRLDFVRVYQRSSERFLEEQCGDVDANGNALSHTGVRSGMIKGSLAPAPHAEPPAPDEHSTMEHAEG